MTTVICATNRPDNLSQIIARNYLQAVNDSGTECKYFSLQDLPEFNPHGVYRKGEELFSDFVDNYLKPSDRLIIVLPEYNGSYPGIAKLLIDSISPRLWRGKRIALAGVSAGRAGNLRGMDHFASVLNYVGAEVFSFKNAVAHVEEMIEDGEVSNEKTRSMIESHTNNFMSF